MSFFSSFLKGLARAFTIPAAQRKAIDSNPVVQAAMPLITSEIGAAVGAAINKQVSDPVANAIVTAVVQQGISNALGTPVTVAAPAASSSTPAA